MASEAQVLANRQNSQESTAPEGPIVQNKANSQRSMRILTSLQKKGYGDYVRLGGHTKQTQTKRILVGGLFGRNT
jgi:rhodanese-related sulfurtransferase